MTSPIVVTEETIGAAFAEARLERASEALEGIGDPVERAAFLASLPRVLALIRKEAATVDRGLLFAPSDPAASRLMSAVAELAPAESGLEPLTAGGLELRFATNDWWGWFKSVFDKVSRNRFHDLVRPADSTPTPIPNALRLGMIGDWATGLYGAPACAATLLGWTKLDLLIHLGDVYYAGTSKETAERFLGPWPFESADLHRAINSNHEMMSGGFGYFDETLPRFGQASSYFALANDHWLLLGLDTGYVDHDVDPEQVAWVETMVGAANGRRVLFFSHHQLSSHFSPQGDRLVAHLGPVLKTGKVAAWYWGHEHRCAVYEPDPRFAGLLGRCIGHGGVPETRGRFAGYPKDPVETKALWRRFPGKAGAPGGIILDGENPFIEGHERDYAPHGFAVLDFQDQDLEEAIYTPDGQEIYRREVPPR